MWITCEKEKIYDDIDNVQDNGNENNNNYINNYKL